MTSVIRAVIRVSDGVTKQIINHGKGRKVKKGDFVTVHCEGSLAETNRTFWSTRTGSEKPFSFKVGIGHVIAGMDEGIMTMKRGELGRLYIEPHKGYGSKDARLVFEIEVLKVNGE
ncbi:Peptidyl-prolyl cis-trans isomerase FKBP3 [Lamellibrachia satsuma]|nr:Peptidyl-prolyl cis-trans isomerase FKBP3 [Lamellibrachia satsuma]